jgi:hypothetical protein
MSFVGVIGKNPLKYFWPIQMLVSAVYKTAQTSAVIDRYRNGGYAALSLHLYPGLWTDGSHAFLIQDSDDNFSSDTTTVVAADLLPGPEVGVYGTASTFVSITAATTIVQRIDYIGRKRYVRVTTTESGATGAAFALVGHLFSPTQFPAA